MKAKLNLKTNLARNDINRLLELIYGKEAEFSVINQSIDRPQMLGEILVESGIVSKDAIERALKKQKKLGELLVSNGLVTPKQMQKALNEQNKQKNLVSNKVSSKKTERTANVKVSSDKLDSLFNLVGEMVTVQERLSQLSAIITKDNFSEQELLSYQSSMEEISEELSSLTGNLRDNALSIRMLPIESTFNKFRRLVHDLAASLSKEIQLTMSGTETEIDKTVIDKLDEPLMHMIRNCADHAIESPEERIKAGKNRYGTIHLSAEHVAGNVVIHIEDDGAGLNREKILNKAVERNIVPENAELSDKEVFGLIFEPGFSTAAAVTNVSGRGVGMDVVKKTIEKLRGYIEIDSKPGKGTKIHIVLPLSLAIIDGLLVTISEQAFILPLSVVEECVELNNNQEISKTAGENLINLRGQLVPYVRLREVFYNNHQKLDIEQIVITNIKNKLVGFVVDTVVGEHKTVIKPLGKVYKQVPAFTGATIMGDGSVAIIIDINQLA